jgi:hypothetical protein
MGPSFPGPPTHLLSKSRGREAFELKESRQVFPDLIVIEALQKTKRNLRNTADGIRTRILDFGKDLLYPLSYGRKTILI